MNRQKNHPSWIRISTRWYARVSIDDVVKHDEVSLISRVSKERSDFGRFDISIEDSQKNTAMVCNSMLLVRTMSYHKDVLNVNEERRQNLFFSSKLRAIFKKLLVFYLLVN